MKRLTFVSFDELHRDVSVFAQGLSCDGIVGVPRSGLMVAHLLALHMHLPVLDLHNFLRGEPFFSISGECVGMTGKRVLVFDDSCGSGRTMLRTMARVKEAGLDVRFAALYSHDKNQAPLDIWLRKIASPRIFAWNLWRHHYLRRSMVDFDGVLCPDPPRDDDVQGGRYHRYIEDAPVLFRPIEPLKAVVTNRLEKWRSVSQKWLDDRRIKTNDLVMTPYKTAQERRENHDYGMWKGRLYRDSDASLFIESSTSQAEQIYEVARKPVLCVDNMGLIQ